jgi:hypothetical protein
MSLAEKREIVYECYCLSLDKEMAYKKAQLKDEEIKLLNEDYDFQERLDICLIQEKEDIIFRLKNLTKSENPNVALNATKELGRLIYPELFEEKPKSVVKTEVHIHNTKEENEDIADELGRVVEDQGHKFKKEG